MLLVVFIFVAYIAAINARGQWYLTGTVFNDKRETSIYEHEMSDVWHFTANPQLKVNDSHTSFGGALAVYVGHNTTLDTNIESIVADLFRNFVSDENCGFEVTDVWIYNTFVTVTQSKPLEYEIGLFDRMKYIIVCADTFVLTRCHVFCRNEFTQKAIHQVKLGKEWLVRAAYRCSELIEVHKICLVADLQGLITVAQHIWDAKQFSPVSTEAGIPAVVSSDSVHKVTSCEMEKDPLDLRVMTYNIWHNNPPEWLIHNR
jgi:hypothetical protein